MQQEHKCQYLQGCVACFASLRKAKDFELSMNSFIYLLRMIQNHLLLKTLKAIEFAQQ